MARLLPKLGGTFLQAVSEVATINHLYGAGGAGLRGDDLHLLARLQPDARGDLLHDRRRAAGRDRQRHARRPGARQHRARAVRHQARSAAASATATPTRSCWPPATPQEMLDLTMLAFELSFKYRNPVIIARRRLPRPDDRQGRAAAATSSSPGCPAWAVSGDRGAPRAT